LTNVIWFVRTGIHFSRLECSSNFILRSFKAL
jgi:hypothetical protein